jgi:hypothetical protein
VRGGTTWTWPHDPGLMSMNATVRSSSSMRVEGSSPAMIWQKMQSGSVATTGDPRVWRRWSAAALACLLACAALVGCGGGGGDGTPRGGADGRADTPATELRRVARHHGPRGGARAAPSLVPAGRCGAGPGFSCARLSVPLDHAGRRSGRLRLRVAVERGERPNGPLLVLAGGPGQAGIPFAAEVRRRLGDAADGFRLVLLDQRGTGAGALRCSALQRAVGASDLAVAPPGAVEACARRLDERRDLSRPLTASATSSACAARSAPGAGPSPASPTGPMSPSATPCAIPTAWAGSSWTPWSPRRASTSCSAGAWPHRRASCARSAPRRTAKVTRWRTSSAWWPPRPTARSSSSTPSSGCPSASPASRRSPPRCARPPRAVPPAWRGLIAGVRENSDAPVEVFSAGLHAATLCAESRAPVGLARRRRPPTGSRRSPWRANG